MQSDVGHWGQMCSRCWCQFEVPSGWKWLLKALGSGCLKLSGMSQTPALPWSALELVFQSQLLKGHLVLGRGLQLEPTCQRWLSGRVNFGTDL